MNEPRSRLLFLYVAVSKHKKDSNNHIDTDFVIFV